MVRTEFYIAGGNQIQMSTKLADCTKLCEIDGILYDYDGNRHKWVKNSDKDYFTERIVMKQQDNISEDGIVRIIIFSVGN
jgi:hypothetical protein